MDMAVARVIVALAIAAAGGVSCMYGLLFILAAVEPTMSPETALPYLLVAACVGAIGLGGWCYKRLGNRR